MAFILKVDGSKETLDNVNLETLQKAVGGFIEVVPTNDGREIVLNEEGKLQGLKVNLMASALAEGVIAENDRIVGDVVICDMGEMK